jgi:hypothetical protein
VTPALPPYCRMTAWQRWEKTLVPKMLAPEPVLVPPPGAASLHHPLRAVHCHHCWSSGTRQ